MNEQYEHEINHMLWPLVTRSQLSGMPIGDCELLCPVEGDIAFLEESTSIRIEMFYRRVKVVSHNNFVLYLQ